MKLKNVSITVISGVAALSVFALTSCGEKESIDIKSYSNEITEEKFGEETEKFREVIDLSDGYELTSYTYQKSDRKQNDQKGYQESINKSTEKFDKVNNILYSSYFRKSEEDTPEDKGTGTVNREYQYQMDGANSYRIDLTTKLYTVDVEPGNRATTYANLMDYYQNAMWAASMINSSIATRKFFKDDDVFTVETTVDEAKKNEYNNNQAGEIKTNINYDGKLVIQFYAKDDTYYIAYEATAKGTNTLSKGDKKIEQSIDDEASGYVKIVKKNPTVEKLDISKYKFFTDFVS